MLKLIKNGFLYNPDCIGKRDILLVDGKIGFIEECINPPENFVDIEVIDAEGKLILPGFIDSHVHILGGGGDSGYKTRTPELMLSVATRAGITTVVGVIGEDRTTRTMASLVGKADSLEEEGLTCYIYTGAYQLPVKTLTDSVENDLILIERIIGVGEIAISDIRSSQPTVNEIARIAAAARNAGSLCGKKGVINIHVGEGKDKLSLLKAVVEQTETPISQLYCTHINRTRDLFEDGIEFAKMGGYVDFTTSTDKKSLETKEVKCSKALKEMLDRGVPIEQISFTSDGQINLPDYNESLEKVRLEIGNPKYLYKEVRDAILEEGIPVETAIRVITANPADILGLSQKGYVKEGKDADLVMVDEETLEIDTVIAKGRTMVHNKEILVKGTYEDGLLEQLLP